jgi:hypothetical protein
MEAPIAANKGDQIAIYFPTNFDAPFFVSADNVCWWATFLIDIRPDFGPEGGAMKTDLETALRTFAPASALLFHIGHCFSA